MRNKVPDEKIAIAMTKQHCNKNTLRKKKKTLKKSIYISVDIHNNLQEKRIKAMALMTFILSNPQDAMRIEVLSLLFVTACTLAQTITSLTNMSSLFSSVGSLYTERAYAHLHVQLKLQDVRIKSTFLRSLNQRVQILKIPATWKPQIRVRAEKRLAYLKHFMNVTTHDSIARLTDVMAHVHDGDPSHAETRNKRQVVAASLLLGGAAGAITGIISDMFTEETVDQVITNSQKVISKTVEENIINIHNNRKDISVLNETIAVLQDEFAREFMNRDRLEYEESILRTAFIVSQTSLDIRHIADTIAEALQGRITLDSINAVGLNQALNQLRSEAVKKGYELTTGEIHDLQQASTSYLINRETEEVHLILHISMFRPETDMELLKYHPCPIPLPAESPDDSFLYLEIQSKNEFISISRDGTSYIPLGPTDLEACQKDTDRFYCPINTKFKQNRRHCLLSLYQNKPNQIKEDCPMFISKPYPKAERIDQDTWAIFDEGDIRIVCPNTTIRQPLPPAALLRLGPDCIANSDNINIIRPAFEADVTIKGIVNNRDISPDMWITQDERPILKKVVAPLLEKIGQPIDINRIRRVKEYQDLLAKARTTTWSFHWPSFIMHGIFPSLGMIVVIIVLYYTCRIAAPLIIAQCPKRQRPRTPIIRRFSYHQPDHASEVIPMDTEEPTGPIQPESRQLQSLATGPPPKKKVRYTSVRHSLDDN